MPPTPFEPSHQSPFKSTLSSSQQPRCNHSSQDNLRDGKLSVQDIVSSQWTYHCEGGKNVLLSLILQSASAKASPFVIDGKPLALRIAKSESGISANSDDADRFTQEIIAPMIGSQSLLPFTITLPLQDSRDRRIIDTIAGAIEVHRPSFRRASKVRIDADFLTHVHAIEDVTAPSIDGGNTLCVEIKPKWGFLPHLDSIPMSSPHRDVKTKYSRYKMHRVAKSSEAGHAMTAEQFEQIYDPLDLYSPDEIRRKCALRALYQDWRTSNGATNNFRLFWNGTIVATDDRETLRTIAEFLSEETGIQSSDECLQEGLLTMLNTELSKRQVKSFGTSKGACTVLERLAYLQSTLDPFDVEGLSEAWLKMTSCETLGEFKSTQQQLDPDSVTVLSTPPTVNDLKSCLIDFQKPNDKHESELERTPAQNLARHIYQFLLSSTFKDCSLLIRCNKTETRLQTTTKVIDLDMKPMSKLAKFQATDRKVCSEFLKWTAGLENEPPHSISSQLC